MKKLGLALSMIMLFPTTAYADKNDHGSEDKEQDNSGKCRNAENCQDNDFSPSFDKSPVQDSFNPTICLPASTCNFGGNEQTLPSNLDPRCVPFHCDPKPS